MCKERDRAVQLLHHYISRTMDKAGMRPDGDTYAEIADCVDSIIAASAEQMMTRLRKELSISSLPVWTQGLK